MASTSNNSGLNGNIEDELGPDEQYDDETITEYRRRMKIKKEWIQKREELKEGQLPPCIG